MTMGHGRSNPPHSMSCHRFSGGKNVNESSRTDLQVEIQGSDSTQVNELNKNKIFESG